MVTAEQAEANLRHDSRAAANGRRTPLEHVLNQSESHVSDEGENLLQDRNGQPAGAA